MIKVTSEFLSDDTNIIVSMRPGMRGFIDKIDTDGDINAFMPTICENGLPRWMAFRWMSQNKFAKLQSKRVPTT